MKRFLGAAVVAALFVSVLALPASAAVPVDGGVLAGVASVGKVEGACTNSGGTDATGNPGGGGLGLPVEDGVKNGFYRLSTSVAPAVFIGYVRGSGALAICGKLTSVAGLGAACGMSKGYAGRGLASFLPSAKAPTDLWLSNVGWKLTVGGTLPVIGDISTVEKGAKEGNLYALVQARGDIGCVTKNKPTAPGATSFTVAGVWAAQMIDSGPKWNDITNPIDPKDDGPSSATNPWGNKK